MRGKTKTTVRGPPMKMTKSNELHLAKYVDDRYEMGIPISAPTFFKHLKIYMTKNKIKSPFKKDGIGMFLN